MVLESTALAFWRRFRVRCPSAPAVASLVVLLLLGGLRGTAHAAEPSRPTRKPSLVLIVEFKQHAGADKYAFLGAAIPAVLQSELVTLQGIAISQEKMAPPCDVPARTEQGPSAQTYYLVQGSFEETADQLTVSYELRLVDGCQSQILFHDTQRFPTKGLLSGLTSIAQQYAT